MVHAFSLHPLTEELRIKFKVGPFGTCGGHIDTWAVFSANTVFRIFSVSIIVQVFHVYSLIYHRRFLV